jgi:hypothetical protein
MVGESDGFLLALTTLPLGCLQEEFGGHHCFALDVSLWIISNILKLIFAEAGGHHSNVKS